MSGLEVSVVLAVRNDAAGLETAARSILAQRDVALELIIVDDESRDATPRVLRELSERDPRVLPLEGGGGLTRSLALGCSRARASYIARQDADDRSAPHRLARQLERMRREPDLAFVSCWTECVAPQGECLFVVRGGCDDDAALVLDPEEGGAARGETVGPSSHGSVLFRRAAYERVGGYRVEFRLAQDWDLWWRLAELGRFATVPEVLYVRRLLPDSLSLSAPRLQRRFGALAREAARRRRRHTNEQPAVERAAELSRRVESEQGATRRPTARGDYFLGATLLAAGNPSARRYLARALRADPFSIRTWIRWLQASR